MSMWQDKARCAEVDPELFFPERGNRSGPALRVCGSCPVQEACLTFAVEHAERGVWGATTERQRRRLRVVAAKPVPTTCATYPAGYRRHLAAHERPCEECRAAYNTYQRGRAAARAAALYRAS